MQHDNKRPRAQDAEAEEPSEKRSKTQSVVERRLVPLHEVPDAGLEAIARITHDPAVSRWVADGRAWPPARARELADCEREAWRRSYWSWGLEAAGEWVGFVGLRPSKDRAMAGQQLRFFVARGQQRRGHARWAVAQALQRYAEGVARPGRPVRVWATARMGNEASAGLLRALGFAQVADAVVCGEREMAFVKLLSAPSLQLPATTSERASAAAPGHSSPSAGSVEEHSSKSEMACAKDLSTASMEEPSGKKETCAKDLSAQRPAAPGHSSPSTGAAEEPNSAGSADSAGSAAHPGLSASL
eukprot:m51a1_g8593 hypothetical protein (301) ;mRNA; r:134919-136221